MPINKLRPTKSASAAIAAVLAASAGGYALMPGSGVKAPDDVVPAATYVTKPWEGRELRAYRDAVGVVTICRGDTFNVRMGMVETPAGCDARLVRRMLDFREQLVACMRGFDRLPLSVRAMFNTLGHNIGTGAACKSSAAPYATAGRYLDACNAATAYNRAAGQVLIGLVKRREMGDAETRREDQLAKAARKARAQELRKPIPAPIERLDI